MWIYAFKRREFKETLHLRPRQYRCTCLFHFFTLWSLSIDRRWKRRRQQTAPWKDWVENVVHGWLILKSSTCTLAVDDEFPIKSKEIRMRCSKCLVTACPKRSMPLSLCLSAAAFSPFAFLVTRSLFRRPTSLCPLSLRELGLAWSLRKWFQRHFPLGAFLLYAWKQQGLSVPHEPFIDFEFRMIKDIQLYSYLFPWICRFLASIRILVKCYNYHFSKNQQIMFHFFDYSMRLFLCMHVMHAYKE